MNQDFPVIVGALGGSGTRVFVRILRQMGVYIGDHLNDHDDAIPFRDFYRAHTAEYLQAAGALAPERETEISQQFDRAVAAHLAGRQNEPLWAAKNPRSLYFLPFLNRKFPGFRFIHVVRSGLDMAFSSNRNQVQQFRVWILSEAERSLPAHRQALLFWGRVNESVADYGENHLGDRYLRIAFEEICLQPERAMARIHDFIGNPGPFDLAAAIGEIQVPPTIGRWQDQPVRIAHPMMQAGRSALERFGYWDQRAWEKLEQVVRAPRWKRWYCVRQRARRYLAAGGMIG